MGGKRVSRRNGGSTHADLPIKHFNHMTATPQYQQLVCACYACKISSVVSVLYVVATGRELLLSGVDF